MTNNVMRYMLGVLKKGHTTFVLDAYHKNKSINGMLADCTFSEKKMLSAAITQALNDEDEEYWGNAVQYLLRRAPEREKKILQAAHYLQKHRTAISIRQTEPEAAKPKHFLLLLLSDRNS